jgi:hypothetical protein
LDAFLSPDSIQKNGSLILAERKAKGKTLAEIGDALGISDKTVGEVRNRPCSGTDSHQDFLGNRGGRGHHFFEEPAAFLVGSANADAPRGSVFEHGAGPWWRRRGDREGEGDMGRSFCSEAKSNRLNQGKKR